MNAKQLAEFLMLGEQRVRARLRDGSLPFVCTGKKKGHSRTYRSTEILEYAFSSEDFTGIPKEDIVKRFNKIKQGQKYITEDPYDSFHINFIKESICFTPIYIRAYAKQKQMDRTEFEVLLTLYPYVSFGREVLTGISRDTGDNMKALFDKGYIKQFGHKVEFYQLSRKAIMLVNDFLKNVISREKLTKENINSQNSLFRNILNKIKDQNNQHEKRPTGI